MTLNYIFNPGISLEYFKCITGVKKSENFHLSPGQVHQNFYLSCYQITCPCQGKINYQLIFYLSCLKFNLSRAPGQVIFLPLHHIQHEIIPLCSLFVVNPFSHGCFFIIHNLKKYVMLCCLIK